MYRDKFHQMNLLAIFLWCTKTYFLIYDNCGLFLRCYCHLMMCFCIHFWLRCPSTVNQIIEIPQKQKD